jgi:hypothetical protein
MAVPFKTANERVGDQAITISVRTEADAAATTGFIEGNHSTAPTAAGRFPENEAAATTAVMGLCKHDANGTRVAIESLIECSRQTAGG